MTKTMQQEIAQTLWNVMCEIQRQIVRGDGNIARLEIERRRVDAQRETILGLAVDP